MKATPEQQQPPEGDPAPVPLGSGYAAMGATPVRGWRPMLATAMWAAISCLAYYIAFQLRFADRMSDANWQVFQQTVGVVVAVRMAVMVWLGKRQPWSRYFSFHDLLGLVQVVSVGSIGVTLVDAMLLSEVTIPRSILLLDWGVMIGAVAAVNSVPRLIQDMNLRRLASNVDCLRALIVGADDAGEGLLRALRRSPSLHYCPVGFVDDRHETHGRCIAGVPVLGGLQDLALLVKRHNIEQVLISSGSLPGKEVRRLLDVASEQGFAIRVLPSYEQLLRQDVAVRPREVAIADLLRRPPIDLDNEEVRHWLRGRTVMVTGSAGSIGSEIARQLVRLKPAKIVLLDRSETGQFFLEREMRLLAEEVEFEVVIGDLGDATRLDAIFQRHKPEIIFHAAAYKHVPLMEAHPGEAVKNIVKTTRNVVDLSEKHHVEAFVMISTDKAVNPTSVMGTCKRVAEQYVQAKASTSPCRLVTVRFGNVLDSAGSVVPLFREQIARGGPVTVTHEEMIRYFMLIPEAAQLVIQAGAMGQGGEIFVLDMGEPVRLMDLARDMIRLSGLREGQDIEVEITGLRPGEKLFEELYCESEEFQPTRCEKIMIASGAPPALLKVLANVKCLIGAADEADEVVLEMLHEMVPQHAGSQPAAGVRAA